MHSIACYNPITSHNIELTSHPVQTPPSTRHVLFSPLTNVLSISIVQLFVTPLSIVPFTFFNNNRCASSPTAYPSRPDGSPFFPSYIPRPHYPTNRYSQSPHTFSSIRACRYRLETAIGSSDRQGLRRSRIMRGVCKDRDRERFQCIREGHVCMSHRKGRSD